MSLVYLNGQYLPLEEARIPVMDRGFLLGDGVYEVIPVYGGRLFRDVHHLHRLEQSLKSVRIASPLTVEQWQAIFLKLIEAHGGGDLSIYLQVTRGVADIRDHAFPKQVTPTVFVMLTPIPSLSKADLEPGIKAITVEDYRWKRCDIKAITLLANLLARQEAIDENAAEAIVIRDGLALEGAASNLFIVVDGVLITPPKSQFLLPGITRDLILELAEKHQLPYREADIPVEQLQHASEIWITSSTKEIRPVIELDHKPVSAGVAGPVWQQLYAIYHDYKSLVRSGQEV